ncbi:MAG: ATP-binding protein [Paracoccaceae bacterium]
MIHHAEIAPVMACRLEGGNTVIPGIVDEVLSHRHAWVRSGQPTPEMLELLGLALNEVLHTVVEFAGAQLPDSDSRVELWIEKSLVILTVRFHGRGLPQWLTTNWDRGQEPAVLAPPQDVGWGWLLVREAMDSVNYASSGSGQLLFLEKRL